MKYILLSYISASIEIQGENYQGMLWIPNASNHEVVLGDHTYKITSLS